MNVRPEILAYYARGEEDGRLAHRGHNRLELVRTQDLLERLLPPAPATVLDVGGGSGVYAEWLASRGYAVTLIDPVPLHVRQAAARPGVTALLGDARALAVPDASWDIVLMLGPLYHLLDRTERVRALAEAHRALRPGGTLAAAMISRYAPLIDSVAQNYWAEPEARATVATAVATGGQVSDGSGRFTTAYFHHPDEPPAEFADAGFAGTAVYGIEGPVWPLLDGLDGWLDDPDRRVLLLDALRRVEREPSLLGASAHLLAVSRRPPAPGGTA